MKTTKILLLSIIVFFLSYQGHSQCSEPSSILSAYYSYAPNSKFGMGIEAGKLNSKSPWGVFAGCNFQLFNEQYRKTDTAISDNMVTRIYFKGTYRVTRIEHVLSFFVVASPQYSLQTGFDLQAGTKFIFPLSDKMAIGTEPLYSIKQNSFLLNFHLAVCIN